MRSSLPVWFIAGILTLSACKDEFVPPHRIDIPDKEVILTGEKAKKNIRFATNAESWYATSDEWCTVTPDHGGKGLTVVTISATDNTGEKTRNTSVRFFTDETEMTLPVAQRPKDAIKFVPNRFEVGWRDTSIYLHIYTKEDIPVENILPDPLPQTKWMYFRDSLSPDWAYSPSKKIDIYENTSTEPRSKTIYFYEMIFMNGQEGHVEGAWETLHITQQGRPEGL